MDGLFKRHELVVIFSRSPAHFALQERINLLRSLLHLRSRLGHIGLRITTAADLLQLRDHIRLRQLSVLALNSSEEFLGVRSNLLRRPRSNMALDDAPAAPVPLNRLNEAHVFSLGPPPNCLADFGRLRHTTVAFALVARRKAHQFLRLAEAGKRLLQLLS